MKIFSLLLCALLLVVILVVARPVDSKTKPGKSSSQAQTIPTEKSRAHELLLARTVARNQATSAIDPDNLSQIQRKILVEPEFIGNDRHYYLLVFDEDLSKKV